MKLNWANWAFRTFLFRVSPSISISLWKPASWSCCRTYNQKQPDYNWFIFSITRISKLVLYLHGIVVIRSSNRDNHSLPRGQPERPLPAEVLTQNRHHTLDRSENSPVNNHRTFPLPVLSHETQVKALRQLEIELDGGALVRSLECVHDGDVNFGTVEGAVFRVQFPWQAELVQTLFQLLRKEKIIQGRFRCDFCKNPNSIITKAIFTEVSYAKLFSELQ